MKNNIMKSLVGSGLALALAAVVWSPAVVSAQQVKGAQLLMNKPVSVSVAAAPAARPMACPKCTTEFSSRVDNSVRGANKPVVTAAKHLCGGCDTSIKTTGVGKHATDAVVHTCSMNGSAPSGCCK
jgi:hypothetical protein